MSKQRSELCCMTLISCLLETCKPEVNSGTGSDTSSVEILKALTSHLASPLGKHSPDVSQNHLRNDRPDDEDVC